MIQRGCLRIIMANEGQKGNSGIEIRLRMRLELAEGRGNHPSKERIVGYMKTVLNSVKGFTGRTNKSDAFKK